MFTQKFDDFPIFYDSKGAGESLILIPGFVSGAWTWFCQTEELSKDFRVITFDPRGIGRSPNNSQNLSMETYLADVLEILDELEVEKTNVLGASFGGFIALEFALRFPEKVEKLILACTTAGGKNHFKPAVEISRSFTPNPEYTLGEHIRHFFRPAFTEKFNREHADIVEKVCRLREQNTVSEATYAAQLQTAFSFDVADKIEHIKHKTLVITGDQDNLVPMRNSLNLAEKIPNAELKIIEDGSHMIFVENADEFNKIVGDFVNREL